MGGVAEAAKYRFKVDLTIFQDTDWAEHVRHPHPGDAYCGDRDVHYVYKGEGGGQLKAKIRRGRVTFSGTKRFLQSSEIKVPGSEDQPALLHEQEAAGRTGGF